MTNKIFLKLLINLALMVVLSLSFNQARASHISGADISYQCIGQDSFLIRIKLWRDCSGIDITNNTITLTATSDCGGTATATLNRLTPPPGNGLGNGSQGFNVSQLCDADSCCSTCLPTSAACTPACTTTTQTGYLEYIYEGIIVLSPPCDSWRFGYSPPPARNTLINSNSGNTWVQSFINNATEPCNSSPDLTPIYPIPYACLNAPFSYSFSPIELDGDSMVFSIDTGWSAQNNRLVYLPPYSPTQPITGIAIDPLTGVITFTPAAVGAFVVVIKVDEYRNYNLVEEVPYNCSFNGNRTLYSPYPTQLDTFCFAECGGCVNNAPLRNVTFSVDLRSDTLISNVALAGSFNSFSSTATPMTDANNDSIYEVTVQLAEGSYEYKFVNNSILEPVVGTCANGRFGGRTVKVSSDTTLRLQCFAKCDTCFGTTTVIPPTTPKYTVTFRVNMNNIPISPQGVFVAGSWNNFEPSGQQMTLLAGSIYTYTMQLDSGETFEYRYLNGNSLFNAERIIGSCTVDDGYGTQNRTLTLSGPGTLPIVCFGSCTNCTQLHPTTFCVDLRNEPRLKDTISLIGDFQSLIGQGNDWQPGQILLTDPDGDSIYCITLNLPMRYHQYRFVNGQTLTETRLLGSTMRDFQFRIEPCVNTQPNPPAGGITNVTGGVLLNPNTVEVCEGDLLQFEMQFTDADAGNSISVISAIDTLLPGSIITYSGTNPMTMTVSWQATPNSPSNIPISMLIRDDNCPVPGISSYSIYIKVNKGVYAGPDYNICRGDTVQLQGFGINTFLWSVLSGSPFNLGVNIDCIDCALPRVNPTVSTTYILQSATTSICPSTDTVTVNVGDDFTLNFTPDTTICFNDSSLVISVQPSLTNNGYSYKWSPSAYLNYDTLQSPTATPILSKRFFVTVTSDSGCTKSGSMYLGVTTPFPPNIIATADDTLGCAGLVTNLSVNLGENPTTCGISSQPCVGAEVPVTIGNGTAVSQNGTSAGPPNWPTPYGGQFAFTRSQYLVRASELAAAGISSGKLTSLSFDVVNLNGSSGQFQQFQIQIGCVPDTVLTGWRSGLSTVFTPKTINVTNGWNTHVFDNLYNYDGNSNLVIQICYANPVSLSGNNVSVRLSTTPVQSSMYFASNNTLACISPNVSWIPLAQRPNLRFGYCAGPNPLAYTFNWFPTLGLSDSVIINPTASLNEPITYFVQVTDTFGACVDTAQVNILLAKSSGKIDTTVCAGDTFQMNLTFTPSCPGDTTFYWTPATGLSNDSILNPFISVTQPTTYVLHSLDDCGCAITDTIVVNVNQLGEPRRVGIDPSCGADDGVFVLSNNGGISPFEYSIDSGFTFQVDSSFVALAAGFYNLQIRDSIGCLSPIVLDTLYNPLAPFIDSVQSSNLLCFDSDDGTIEIYASQGQMPYIYSIDSGTTWSNSSLFVGLKAGWYKLIAASSDTCQSFPVDVFLSRPDSLYIGVFQAYNDTCNQLCDGWAETQIFGGTLPYSITWSGQQSDSLRVFDLCAGSYTLNVLDSNGCQVDSSFIINEPSRVVLDSIIITDITCFEFDNGVFEIYPSGGIGDFSSRILPNQSFTADMTYDSLAPGVYNVEVRDSFKCTAFQQITLTEPPKVMVQTPFDSAKICVSTCIDLSAIGSGGNGGPYTFSWVPSVPDTNVNRVCPDRPRNYAVFARDPLGCTSDPQIIFVDLYDSLRLTLSPDTFTCSGDPVQLFALPSGGDSTGFIFEWQPMFGLNNPLIDSPIFFFDTTVIYTVNMKDLCGSPSVSATVKVEVNPSPIVDFTTDKEVDCEPAEVIFFNQSTNSKDCQWIFGDGTTSQGCLVVSHTYRNDGEYDVTLFVTSAEGCSDSILKPNLITINRTPVANFLINPEQTSVLNTEVEFTDLSLGSIISWNWSFAGLGSSVLRNPVFEFPNSDTATYPIKLTVESPRGCVDDTIKYVRITSDFTVFVPNAFTPNVSNGLNDVFKPELVGVRPDEYIFTVYNRWGDIVYQTNNIAEGWDGTIGGSPAATGVYVWKLQFGDFTSENNTHEYSGQVTIIR